MQIRTDKIHSLLISQVISQKEKRNVLYLFDWQRSFIKIRGYSIYNRVQVNRKKREYNMLFPCRVRLSYLRERSCLNRTRHEHVSYRPQSYSATQPGDSSASKEQRGCTQTNHNSHKSVYTSAKSKWRAHIHLFSRVYFLPLFQSRTEQPASSAKILLTLVCDGRLTTREGSTAVVFLTR